jgi:hypothetical protein
VVLTRATQRNNPEDTILHSHRRESLKSYKFTIVAVFEHVTLCIFVKLQLGFRPVAVVQQYNRQVWQRDRLYRVENLSFGCRRPGHNRRDNLFVEREGEERVSGILFVETKNERVKRMEWAGGEGGVSSFADAWNLNCGVSFSGLRNAGGWGKERHSRPQFHYTLPLQKIVSLLSFPSSPPPTHFSHAIYVLIMVSPFHRICFQAIQCLDPSTYYVFPLFFKTNFLSALKFDWIQMHLSCVHASGFII